MKKLMLIAAVTIASVSAHASKARLDALQDAAHIRDIQEVFQEKPEEVNNYEAATVEFGSATAAQEAEGGFIRKMGDSAWSLYLGRSSTTYADFVSGISDALNSAAAGSGDAFAAGHTQQNPLQFTYGAKMGSISWGAGLLYVGNSYKDAQTFGTGGNTYTASKVDQNIMGLLVGATNGTWDAQLRQGLMGETKATVTAAAGTVAGVGITAGNTLKTTSTNSTRLSGGYLMDTMYFYGSYQMGAGEVKASAKLADVEDSTLTVGVINSHKKDGVDFFYGISGVMATTKEKVGNTKVESTRFPLIVGVESEVASWLVLRGALSQSLSLLSSSKVTGGKAQSVSDDTTTTVGAGFKWGKATIDTVLGMGSDGNFGFDEAGGNFAQASVTYAF